MSTAITTTAPGWSAALSPTTTDEAWKVAQALAKSQFVPKAFQGQPSEILIAAAMGARLGLDVFSALQSIAVVNGKPSLYGDALLAVCQARPDWRGQVVTWTGQGDAEAVTVTVKRQTGADVLTYDGKFSVTDAKKAGVWTKAGPWSQYPRRMLELRARSYALRGAFADALLGFHAREEVEDYVEVQAERVSTEPRRRVRQVAPSLGAVDAAPASDPVPTEAPVADVEASDPPPVQDAHDSGTDAGTEPPTEEAVREAVNRCAKALGSAKPVIAELERVLGYAVPKASDIKQEDRAEAIRIADDLAGLPPAEGG